jgi:hypothetical protein
LIAAMHFRPNQDAETFQQQALATLTVLATCPGFVRGTVGRATDDDRAWILVTEWESVGAYRRGLGGYDVKLIATPLLAQAIDQPSAFEALVTISDDGSTQIRSSDRALDADWTPRTEDS